MIEPYDINNSNLNLMIGNMMEKAFFFLIILVTVWIFISLTIWLIRRLFKIRKSNKIRCEEFYFKCIIAGIYNSNSYCNCFSYKVMEKNNEHSKSEQ